MRSRKIKRYQIHNLCLLLNLDDIPISAYYLLLNVKVKRVLPDWLAKPTVVSVDLKHLEVPIDGIPELDPALVQKLKNKGCTHFFPGNLNHIQISNYT